MGVTPQRPWCRGGGQDLALGDASPEWRRQRGATRGALARAVRHLEPLLELQGWALCQVSTPTQGPPTPGGPHQPQGCAARPLDSPQPPLWGTRTRSVTPFLTPQELSSYGAAPVDLFEAFTFHTCSTICRLAFGDLVGISRGCRVWVSPGGAGGLKCHYRGLRCPRAT